LSNSLISGIDRVKEILFMKKANFKLIFVLLEYWKQANQINVIVTM